MIVYKEGVKADDPKLADKVLRTKQLGAGTAFGELALMYGDKRTATVVAEVDCELFALDGATFKNVIVKQSLTQKNVSLELLN